eukprot:3856834-Karenia_brevis.AAC.1
MPLDIWWDKIWSLKKGAAGWCRSAQKIGVPKEVVQNISDKEEVLEMLVHHLDKDLNAPHTHTPQ